MNRSTVFAAFALAALLSLVGIVATGPAAHRANAQDATTQDHPLAGTWIVDSDTQTEGNSLETATFYPDGSFADVQADGTVVLGVWEATGPTTATLTFTKYESDDNDMNAGGWTVRASLEVSDDGASFTGPYTVEFLNADGTTSGQLGPEMVGGTRMAAEAPGTPVASMDEYFNAMMGTPEATPSS